ncbi:MAG: N-acetylmuramoyl-L-alanine amidase [Leptospiraceae bacterium]|nr:N-acetylmuramoyl-L-alanine amidase [Leptospiraceae bacterium]MCP5511765.1 N-acetylmuramoyl-L-alanine amidase [Leptospiraceae bacterium]
MVKNKILIRILILFLFHYSSAYAEDQFFLIGGKYIDFSELQKKYEYLKIRLDGPGLFGTIRGNTEDEINFKIDSPYYHYKNTVNRLSVPFRYKKNKIYIPVELIRPILSHLVENESSFSIEKERVLVNIYGEIRIKPESIQLETVVIDPGHGGSDSGTPSVYGDYEKSYNLAVSRTLSKYIRKKYPKVKIVMTRNKDEFVSLDRRTEIANAVFEKSNNSIFISLHCNSNQTRHYSSKGYEIFYLDQSREIEKHRERTIISTRLVDFRAPSEIQKIHGKMVIDVVQRKSILLADKLDSSLSEAISARIISRGVKRHRFRVLRKTLMPSVLVELGFLTNPEDARLISDPNMQIKIARAIMEGIKGYIQGDESYE